MTGAATPVALAVDVVLFGWSGGPLEVLLVRRAHAPHLGAWALPGGFVGEGEPLDVAAQRELVEETGVTDVFLEQLYTFGAPGRDPRGRVVSVAWVALVSRAAHPLQAATDAAEAAWFPAHDLPHLAFDHADILAMARDRVRGKVRWAPIGFQLLPRSFTLGQLQRLYEAVLGHPLDKRNFRRKILKLGLLEPLGRREGGVAHRPSLLYRFDRERYTLLSREGLVFEL